MISRRNSCSHDSTFDSVDEDHSGAISLAEYLVWVTAHDFRAGRNPEVMDVWIKNLYGFVIAASTPTTLRLLRGQFRLTFCSVVDLTLMVMGRSNLRKCTDRSLLVIMWNCRSTNGPQAFYAQRIGHDNSS